MCYHSRARRPICFLLLLQTFLARTRLSEPLLIFPLPFRLPGRFFLFRDSIRKHFFFVNLFIFYEHVYAFRSWASSGPFPLSAHDKRKPHDR